METSKPNSLAQQVAYSFAASFRQPVFADEDTKRAKVRCTFQTFSALPASAAVEESTSTLTFTDESASKAKNLEASACRRVLSLAEQDVSRCIAFPSCPALSCAKHRAAHEEMCPWVQLLIKARRQADLETLARKPDVAPDKTSVQTAREGDMASAALLKCTSTSRDKSADKDGAF